MKEKGFWIEMGNFPNYLNPPHVKTLGRGRWHDKHSFSGEGSCILKNLGEVFFGCEDIYSKYHLYVHSYMFLAYCPPPAPIDH